VDAVHQKAVTSAPAPSGESTPDGQAYQQLSPPIFLEGDRSPSFEIELRRASRQSTAEEPGVEGHVARAAQRLNLTPSAVSHGLCRRRRLLHDPLFLKTPSSVKPTDRARALANDLTDLIPRAAVLACGISRQPTEENMRILRMAFVGGFRNLDGRFATLHAAPLPTNLASMNPMVVDSSIQFRWGGWRAAAGTSVRACLERVQYGAAPADEHQLGIGGLPLSEDRLSPRGAAKRMIGS
jgi:DNA-binding transcriptional LysR family regulator